jgi:hypothetical protein
LVLTLKDLTVSHITTESPYCLQKWDNLRKQTFVSCFVGWKFCPGYYIITTPTVGSWWS